MVKLTFKPTNIAGTSQFELEADIAITVGDLKQLLSPQLGGLAPDSIRLVCAGRVWQDPSTLESYGVKDGNIVHCLNNPQGQRPASGIASTQELQPANPMMAMMGAGMPMGGAQQGGGDSLQQMMQQSQQMMQQNPEMMQQMMQSPMVQQMLENPDFMRTMMQMNPQTRQLMEEHPEIGRMLEDPEMLRQSARMMGNPSLMREMMRNQDTAMGRLDAMPGGHAALARMHREIVDPLQNAMTANGEANAAVNAYSEDAQGHRNTAPLANPWGPPQAAAQPTPAAAQAPQQQATLATVPASGAPAAGAPVDPMLQMMQMQNGGAGGANPMAQMLQNPQMMQNMMQNPMIQQMTQQMMQNPQMMQNMMQMNAQMFGQQPGADGAQQPNPMANMMQQMMQNPQMMQQVMQMSQAMGQQGGGYGSPFMPMAPAPAPAQGTSTPTPAVDGAGGAVSQPNAAAPPAPQPANPTMNQPVNPFANMMQQMMQNPQFMQGMGGGMGGGMGQPQMPMFGAPQAQQNGGAMDEAQLAAAASNPMVRARFAQQLDAMIAMGFSDEQKCLRALVQCDGNVDRALDKMFSEN